MITESYSLASSSFNTTLVKVLSCITWYYQWIWNVSIQLLLRFYAHHATLSIFVGCFNTTLVKVLLILYLVILTDMISFNTTLVKVL